MIVDTLENIGRYAALGGDLAKGLEFLQRSSGLAFADGKQPILGDAIYSSASTYFTQPAAEKKFEAHDRYIDIQYLLQGRESVFWAPRSTLAIVEPYSESRDVVFLAGREGTGIPLVPGVFAVFFPWDGHKPGCILESSQEVKKLVIKVSAR